MSACMHRFAWSLAFAVLLTMSLGACAPYRLRGRVVQGDVSYVSVVERDDPRLRLPGVAGVELLVTIDPTRLNRERLPGQISGAGGEFAIPIRKIGAGLLNYEVTVGARRGGYQSGEGIFDLPGKSSRILIMLAPGADPRGSTPLRTIEDDLRDFRR